MALMGVSGNSADRTNLKEVRPLECALEGMLGLQLPPLFLFHVTMD
jgi:hypothetical protein